MSAAELRGQIAATICPGIDCESHSECKDNADAVLALLPPMLDAVARKRAADEIDYLADELARIAGGHQIVDQVIGLLCGRAEALRPAEQWDEGWINWQAGCG